MFFPNFFLPIYRHTISTLYRQPVSSCSVSRDTIKAISRITATAFRPQLLSFTSYTPSKTDGAARAVPCLHEHCRVVTEEGVTNSITAACCICCCTIHSLYSFRKRMKCSIFSCPSIAAHILSAICGEKLNRMISFYASFFILFSAMSFKSFNVIIPFSFISTFQKRRCLLAFFRLLLSDYIELSSPTEAQRGMRQTPIPLSLSSLSISLRSLIKKLIASSRDTKT